MRSFGIDERSAALTAEVRALATDYPKGHLIPPHRHDWAQLVYARAGVMTVLTAAGAWVVPPQRAVWMPAEMEHAIRCATRLSMRTLYVDAGARHGLPAGCGVVNVAPLLRELILAGVEAPGAGPRRELLVALLLEEIRAAPLAPLHLPEPEDPRLGGSRPHSAPIPAIRARSPPGARRSAPASAPSAAASSPRPA